MIAGMRHMGMDPLGDEVQLAPLITGDITSDRYMRQVHPDLISADEQLVLGASTVVVCGCGGLGSPVTTYLAAAGIGCLHLFDHDIVVESNLNRQFLYNYDDLGRQKAEVAKRRLSYLNPEIRIEAHATDIMQSLEFISAVDECDIVVDCLDSLTVRRYVGQVAAKARKALVHGGLTAWQGQVAVFLPGEGPTLDEVLFDVEEQPEPPVIGAIAGIVGSLQALEVVKLLLKRPPLDTSMIHVYDGLQAQWFLYPKLS
jgi:adenylyltransferase/sulfurtransferase